MSFEEKMKELAKKVDVMNGLAVESAQRMSNSDMLKRNEINPSGKKYLRKIKTNEAGEVDVYAVLLAFGVTCPARQHAIKKLLCAGLRGKNDELNDLKEAKDATERGIELISQ